MYCDSQDCCHLWTKMCLSTLIPISSLKELMYHLYLPSSALMSACLSSTNFPILKSTEYTNTHFFIHKLLLVNVKLINQKIKAVYWTSTDCLTLLLDYNNDMHAAWQKIHPHDWYLHISSYRHHICAWLPDLHKWYFCDKYIKDWSFWNRLLNFPIRQSKRQKKDSLKGHFVKQLNWE